jgi:hypothetical protein
MNPSLTLYCNCFKDHLNRYSQTNQKNLLCGSANVDQSIKDELVLKGFYFDDTGDNISMMNVWLGDLTGLYWVWKNTKDEFVGTNQYRRYYDDTQLDNLHYDDKTLYISEPVGFNHQSAYDQMIMAHGDVGIKLLTAAASANNISIKPYMVEDLKKINYLSPCNMFFAQRNVFDKLCEILFEIIKELHEGSKYTLSCIQPDNQTRLLAFLAERILNIIYRYNRYFLGDVKIQPISWSVK